MPEDLTPDADELASTNVKTGPSTTNAAGLPRYDAETRLDEARRLSEPLREDAFRDTASNQDDETQGS